MQYYISITLFKKKLGARNGRFIYAPSSFNQLLIQNYIQIHKVQNINARFVTFNLKIR
jgi:hypothetical protein